MRLEQTSHAIGLTYLLGKGAKPFEMTKLKSIIMQNYLETLEALTKDKVINIRDYYCVTLQTGVQLQGVYGSKLLKTFKNRTDLERLNICVGDNGFIAISFKYNGYSVEITLT